MAALLSAKGCTQTQGSSQKALRGQRTRCSATMTALPVEIKPTVPIEGQKTGTSGLRKKAAVFSEGNYLANWVQSLFGALGDEVEGSTMVLGGDGRWFNTEAAQIIIKLCAGNGVKKVLVGQNAYLCTPAASAVIRARGADGGFIMSASHNPGGPTEDWGIKFNYKSGEPAPETITDKVFGFTEKVTELKFGTMADVDLTTVGCTDLGGFEVEVIDPVADYGALFKEVFDFDLIKGLVSRPDFSMTFDALHAITGVYAKPILCDMLGAPESCLKNCVPLEDFGGGHPDPNLTYAKSLVDVMYAEGGPSFGAASDGDGDRNMILGSKFFVTPCDSVAVIAAYGDKCMPYFKGGLKGVARSMPTAAALDRVAEKLGITCFETPTGWKYFGNLMDAGKCSVCGEESFGTGSDHVREKDGMWAVLAWLSILAYRNKDVPAGGTLVSVEDVVVDHWKEYGRNVFSRYDYEGCTSEDAGKMVTHLKEVIASAKAGDAFGEYTLKIADDFEYTDPIDGSVAKGQGLRFIMTDGSRFVFRLSGTGSSGATIRLYIEQYVAPDQPTLTADAQELLAGIIKTALETSKLAEFTGRDAPTVIT